MESQYCWLAECNDLGWLSYNSYKLLMNKFSTISENWVEDANYGVQRIQDLLY